MKQQTVLLTYGGESSEHDVSLASAKNIYAAIDKDRFNVLLSYIDKTGKWWQQYEWSANPTTSTAQQIGLVPGEPKILVGTEDLAVQIDVIFPVLHGKMGEDGTIQGLAKMLHVPIVGCDVEASALCMNKDATKRLAEAEGIPVAPWATVRPGDDDAVLRKMAKSVSKAGPWFVKPARAGSSVGVSKVTSLDELGAAVSTALEHDSLALIETAVVGRELEVAVLGNPPHHKASGVGEIIPGSDFYDYDDKYSSDSTSVAVLNAQLPNALSKVIRDHALVAYETLGCTGLARVDFLLSDDLIPYLNEINTLPGFTDISMYPKLWGEKSLSQTQLVTKLIELAVE